MHPMHSLAPVQRWILGRAAWVQSMQTVVHGPCPKPFTTRSSTAQRNHIKVGIEVGARCAHMEASSVAVAMCAAYASSAGRPCARLRSAASWRAVHWASPCTCTRWSTHGVLPLWRRESWGQHQCGMRCLQAAHLLVTYPAQVAPDRMLISLQGLS